MWASPMTIHRLVAYIAVDELMCSLIYDNGMPTTRRLAYV